MLLSAALSGLALLNLGVPIVADEGPPEPDVVEVEAGDTLGAIADDHDLDVEVLWAANEEIEDPHLISPGDEIVVPDDGSDLDVQPLPPFEPFVQLGPSQDIEEGGDGATASGSGSASSSSGRYGVGEPWATLAECESGNWVNSGQSFEEGSARWNWGAPDMTIPPWGTTIHDGGLQFHPGTWSAFRSDHHPERAYNASPQQQVEVAERVLDAQGWGAWPTCARKMGLR